MTADLAVQTMTSFESSVTLARWAEENGLAGFAVADHYLSGRDDPYALDQLVVLGGVAARTERIELSTLVSPITFRHPAVMLKSAATLAEMSGGRFTLGVGAGWMEPEHDLFGLPFPGVGERFEMMTEALGYLTAALDEGAPGFEGRHYRLAAGTTPLPNGPNIRLVVGGSGPTRTPALAGRFAHEFNAFPADTPYQPRIAAARQSAAAAGRDPDELLISCAFPLLVAETAADVERRIVEVGRARRADPERVRTRWSELGIPFGTVDEVRSGLEDLAAAGIQRVYFQLGLDDVETAIHSVSLLLAD